MIKSKTKLIAVFLICAATAYAYADNIQYTVTDLGTLTGPGSHPTAINDLGEVLGYGDIYTDYSHAFLYTGSGPLVNLGSFGGDYRVSVATAINNSGMVVGYSDSFGSGNPTRAFLYTQSGGMQDLGTLGGAQAEAECINNLGQIVGVAQVASGTYDGFLYSGNGPMVDLGTYRSILINDTGQVVAVNGPAGSLHTYISSGGTGTWQDIGSLGGAETDPVGMNNSGEIVGGSTITTANGYLQPFLYSGGTMTDPGTFGGQIGAANAINDFGVVVGGADFPGDLSGHAFVWYGSGPIQDLNDLVNPSLGLTIEDALAINDNGQIAAEAYQQGGEYHAILLTPIQTPEPSSFGLLLAAIIGVAATRYGACRTRLSSCLVDCSRRALWLLATGKTQSILPQLASSLIAFCASCALAANVYGQDIQYTITDLGTLTGPSSFPTAMNNLGQVAGYGDIYTMYSHAFLYTGSGPLVNLGSFGGDSSVSVATGINNNGMVVGYSNYLGAGNTTHAFVYNQNSGMQDLGTLGGPTSYAEAVNNNGVVVGYSQTASGSTDGFIYSRNGPMIDLGPGYYPLCINDAGVIAAIGGTSTQEETFISSGGTSGWTNIGSLGGNLTQPSAMNSLAEIVGGATISSSSQYLQPFLYNNGTMLNLGSFGGEGGEANGINDYGVVVGGADIPGPVFSSHGFIWYGSGAIADLNTLIDGSSGWTIDDAMAINDQGQIAAEANQPGEDYHAVLLTPIETPEPSSFGLLLAGIIGLAAMRYSARIFETPPITKS